MATPNGRENIYLQISDITVPTYGYREIGKRLPLKQLFIHSLVSNSLFVEILKIKSTTVFLFYDRFFG